MCGICGIVASGRPPEIETVKAMSARLAHRGPDGSGSFAEEGVALGFRRLAIIDLTDAGMQPFASTDEGLQLVHNGEIYNYRELRAELEGRGHRFRSATDTEVILAAYAEWGERCVDRFVKDNVPVATFLFRAEHSNVRAADQVPGVTLAAQSDADARGNDGGMALEVEWLGEGP